jgi:murein DD-endopeptidase MepM/ murein hydrolase activator NlpD
LRLGYRAAAGAAALAFTFSASTLAGGSTAPESPPHHTVALKRVSSVVAVPQAVFPLLGEPQYGDGLDAGRGHEGQDLLIAAGTPIVAVADAVVLETGNDGGRGNYISIYDRAANRTYNYFHMLEPALARQGQHVRIGQRLGEVGCTGSCWGDHLHFELRAGRSTYGPLLNPTPFLHQLEDQPNPLTDIHL